MPAASIEAEVTPSYAIDWVKQTMEFIVSVKSSFEQTKEMFNTRYDDVKTQSELPDMDTLTQIAHLFQHPEDAQNLMFVQQIRRDGAQRWLNMIENDARYLHLAQEVLNEAVPRYDLELNKLEPVSSVIDIDRKSVV